MIDILRIARVGFAVAYCSILLAPTEPAVARSSREPVDQNGNNCITPGAQRRDGNFVRQSFTNGCKIAIQVDAEDTRGDKHGVILAGGATDDAICTNVGSSACGGFVSYIPFVPGDPH